MIKFLKKMKPETEKEIEPNKHEFKKEPETLNSIESLKERELSFEGDALDIFNLAIIKRIDIAIKLANEIRMLHEQNIVHRRISPSNFKIDAKGNLISIGFENAIITNDPIFFKKDILALGVMFNGALKLGSIEDNKIILLLETMVSENSEDRPSLNKVIETLIKAKEMLLQRRGELDNIIERSLGSFSELSEENSEQINNLKTHLRECLQKIKMMTDKIEDLENEEIENLKIIFYELISEYNDLKLILVEGEASQKLIETRIERRLCLLLDNLSNIEIVTIPSHASKNKLKLLVEALDKRMNNCVNQYELTALQELYENAHTCYEKKSQDISFEDIKIPFLRSEMAYFSGINLQLIDFQSFYTPLWLSARPSPSMESEDDDYLNIKLAEFRINLK